MGAVNLQSFVPSGIATADYTSVTVPPANTGPAAPASFDPGPAMGPTAPAGLPNGEANALAQSAGLTSLAPKKEEPTMQDVLAALKAGDKDLATNLQRQIVGLPPVEVKAEPTMQDVLAALKSGDKELATNLQRQIVGLPPLDAAETQGAPAALPAEIVAGTGTGLGGLANPLDSPYFQKNTPVASAAATPAPTPAPPPLPTALQFDFDAYNRSQNTRGGSTMQITASTPGAIWEPESGGRRGNEGHWRPPTIQEVSAAKIEYQTASLPADVQAKIKSGELTPQYSTTATGGGRNGQGEVISGITGFTSPGANDTTVQYDLSGGKTGQFQNQHGGGGFFDRIFSGVGDFIADPSKATTQFFENPGVKEAAVAAAMYYGIPLLTEAAGAGLGAAGAGTLGAAEGALTAAEIAGLPGLAGAAGATTAALTPAALESLIGTAGYGASAAAGAGSGAGAYLAGLGATGATLGSAAPEILTAGSAPGSALAATTATAVPEGLATLATPALTSTAPEILTAGSAPGSSLAATTATAVPEGLAALTTPALTSAAPEILTAGSAPGSALTATTATAVPEGLATLATTVPEVVSAAPEILTAGSAPGSSLAATTGTAIPEGIASLGATTAPAATSINEMIASGMTPGSAGAAGAATGALTPEALAAASGTGLASLSPVTVAANAGSESIFGNPALTEGGFPKELVTGGPGTSVNEMIASGMSPGSAGATGAVTGALTPAELAAASGVVTTGATPALVTAAEEGAQNYIDAGGSAQSGFSGANGTDVALNAADKVAAGTSSGGTLSTAVGNEAVASGLTPGSVGAAANAAGVLTPTQIAAATGAAGLTSLTGADAAAANLATSANEAVASGLAPGSAGAAQAAAGTLTAEQLAAAAGTNTGGINLLDAAKKAKDLLPKKSGSAGSTAGTLGLAALLAALSKGKGTDDSYKGTMPSYSALRTQLPLSQTRPGTVAKPYRPGQGGITYFTPVNYTQNAAAPAAPEVAADPVMYAEGGQVSAGLPNEGNQNMNYPSREGGYGYGGEGAIGQGGIAPQGALPQFAGLGSLGGNPLMAPQAMNQQQQSGIGGLYGGSAPNQSPQQDIFVGGSPQQNPQMGQQGFGMANGGAVPGQYNLGAYSDGGRLLKGPGDGVSDSIPAIIGQKQPARLATGEFVIPARIVSELGNGSTEAGAQRLYEMMKRVQQTRRKTKNVAANTNAAKYLPA